MLLFLSLKVILNRYYITIFLIK